MIIAVTNQKGGVGKSTTVINLSAGLTEQGYKVLIIDLDAQANTTSVLSLIKGETQLQRSLYNVLINFYPMENIIQETNTRNLFIAPSHIRLSGTDLELSQVMDNRSERLKKSLASILSDYDHIIIDTPPSLGLLTINALTACDQVLIPVSTGFFALTGLVQLQETIEMVQQTQLNSELRTLGILCTFSERTKVSREVEQQIRDYFKNLVFQTVIPKNISLEEAHSHHQHIFNYAPKSRGAQAYRKLVKEVLSR